MRGKVLAPAWLTTAAFLVMGAFRIDAVGPNRVVGVHGALHTGAFVVVMVAHVLMFVVGRRAHSRALRVLPFVAPVLAVVGFGLAGLAGALILRAWTLCLVAWVVVTTREASSAQDSSNAVPATLVAV